MSRRQNILLISFLAVIGFLVYLEASKPQPVNWFQSYVKEDKIPYGTYVFSNLITRSLQNKVRQVHSPPFEFLSDENPEGVYFFVNDQLFFGETELDSLLSWTSRGNTLFLAGMYFDKSLLDTLQLKLETYWSPARYTHKISLNLVNENLQKNKYFLDQEIELRYFSKIDTASQTVLGFSGLYEDSEEVHIPRKNFLKIPWGEGSLFLHSQPEVFTNFFLLSGENAEYTANALSYINTDKTIYADNYYKSGIQTNQSILGILLKNRNFKTAYYLMLAGIFLFIIFEGKRKQRKIPVIKPLVNKTVEFTQTISGLYQNQKDYRSVAFSQIRLFLENLRNSYQITTDQVDSEFLENLSKRSGNSLEETKELFSYFEKIQNQKFISQSDLKELYTRIRTFKNPETDLGKN